MYFHVTCVGVCVLHGYIVSVWLPCVESFLFTFFHYLLFLDTHFYQGTNCNDKANWLELRKILTQKVFSLRLWSLSQARTCSLSFSLSSFSFLKKERTPQIFNLPLPSICVHAHIIQTHCLSLLSGGVRCADRLSAPPPPQLLSSSLLLSPPPPPARLGSMHACVCYLQMAEEL